MYDEFYGTQRLMIKWVLFVALLSMIVQHMFLGRVSF